MSKSSIFKEPITWIFCEIPNVPKSDTMQKMQTSMLRNVIHGIRIDKSKVGISLKKLMNP